MYHNIIPALIRRWATRRRSAGETIRRRSRRWRLCKSASNTVSRCRTTGSTRVAGASCPADRVTQKKI